MRRVQIVGGTAASLVALGSVITFSVRSKFETPAPVPINSELTPGGLLSSSVDEVCKVGYTGTLPGVSTATREKVFHRYRIYERRPGEYQIAHLIPLELGGSNDTKNLFPIRVDANRGGYQVGAATRKQLADSLRRMVCSHQIGLAEAQKTMRSADWQSAYKKVVNTELPLYRR